MQAGGYPAQSAQSYGAYPQAGAKAYGQGLGGYGGYDDAAAAGYGAGAGAGEREVNPRAREDVPALPAISG